MKNKFFIAIVILIFTFLSGTIGYKLLSNNDVTLFDCFYMTVITLSTVGYGEIIDLSNNPAARLFTIFLILIGMSNLIFVLSTLTSTIIDGKIKQFLRRQKMKKTIKKFKNHLIICGAGTTGQHIIKELYNLNKDFVIIEENKDVFDEIQNKFIDSVCICGDSTKDEILESAGIKKAKAIAAVLPMDKDNLFLTITAKQLNPNIRIISKIINLDNKRKLLRAGASSIVPPQFIGALRLVSEMVRPKTVGFLDNMLRNKKNLRIDEVKIPKNSWTIGKKLSDLAIRKNVGLQIIAFQNPINDSYNYAPKAADILEENMTLITMGEPEKIKKLEDFVK